MSKSEEGGQEGAKLNIKRHFTTQDVHPFAQLEWEIRRAVITNDKGEVIFEQDRVEMPTNWSQMATNVVVSKYFKGPLGTSQREHSLKQLIGRITETVVQWGQQHGYLTTAEEAETFHAELTYLLVNQMASFNSPVWFNLGIELRPQVSACFINSIDDTMESILELAKTEGMLFKYGSGTGTNLSTIRSSKERLSSGGTASGPVSFMRGFDAFAGAIKSGGKTRRAAKMVILNMDHPDIEEFINCKAVEEKKAWRLIDAGYDGGFNVHGGAYDSVYFQNANNSVRATDEFMRSVINDKEWSVIAVTTGEIMDNYQTNDLMRQIAEAAWLCGDPGMQFDSATNEWHTCPNSGRINASNPCGEFMFLDDSACNLASLNLLKFLKEDGEFDIGSLRQAVHILILAQEIMIDNASYPTPSIKANSHKFRPLGLGYANLGALLMSKGLPYDSDEGRAYAAAVTSLMTGQAYRTSAEIADLKGAFEGFAENREPMLNVIGKHTEHLDRIDRTKVPQDLWNVARQMWTEALIAGEQYGFRNAQVTLLAPTGTISFMMDCDTTGIEPDIALVKYKKLVGGGVLKIVNNTVPQALERLGYDEQQIAAIVEYIDEHETIEGGPNLREKDLQVFDCALKPENGMRSIHYVGHIKMMAAVQPFLSGAISKTVNMPNEATVDEVMEVYIEAWNMGLKAIAVYRDGCKRTQPVSTRCEEKKEKERQPVRRRLPDERQALTHKFSVGDHEGYITAGMYDDGTLGEIFITMSKEGSTVSGLMDSFATAISIALQYGVPLLKLCQKFGNMRFEPQGWTKNKEIPMAKSIMDYIFRWLTLKFLSPLEREGIGLLEQKGSELENYISDSNPSQNNPHNLQIDQTDAPACSGCGMIMIRVSCGYQCPNCGESTGCG